MLTVQDMHSSPIHRQDEIIVHPGNLSLRLLWTSTETGELTFPSSALRTVFGISINHKTDFLLLSLGRVGISLFRVTMMEMEKRMLRYSGLRKGIGTCSKAWRDLREFISAYRPTRSSRLTMTATGRQTRRSIVTGRGTCSRAPRVS